VNEISFSYERMGTKTRFENKASGNSEMAHCVVIQLRFLDKNRDVAWKYKIIVSFSPDFLKIQYPDRQNVSARPVFIHIIFGGTCR